MSANPKRSERNGRAQPGPPAPGKDAARLLWLLQRLLEIPAANLRTALTHAANAIAQALAADKVDAFLYDDSRDSLVVAGVSTQPLSQLQKKLGLDVLPLSNGGRVVHVYRTGESFRTGRLRDDPEELLGFREGLKIESNLGVPLEIGSKLRGALMIASLEPDHFTEDDEAFARSVARWVGMVAHRAELVADLERTATEQGRRSNAEELITVLAHDFRNYLVPISGGLHVLRRRAQVRGDADTLADAALALRGVARMSAMVSDLLDTSRIDRGIFALDLEPTDLTALISEAAAALSSAEHGFVVRAPGRVMVRGDPRRLRQCVDNLLANASAHSPKQAPVSVFVSRVYADGRGFCQVEVIDEGSGIAEQFLPHIFDRFVSGPERKGGLGLGLYLAKQLALAHGGDLLAESPPGRGAHFVLRIPLDDEDEPDVRTPAT